MTLGGIDLLRSGLIKGVDIYLEAGQSPQVVIRPILDQVLLDLTAGDLDGKAPRYKVAPDVAFLLEEMGWMAPEAAEVAQYAVANLKRELAEAQERVKAQEAELETAAKAVEEALDDKAQMAAEVESWKRSADQAGVAILEISRERGEAQDQVAQMAEELANVHGQLEDLKLANATLHQEMESLRAETAGRHPYEDVA
ncbi:hypothetical protein ACIBI0_38760 [Microbispora rosea]|uniref:hypothetical protein n=1 Tax=Microbispora rosea TaxID=58117 RepID=UPI0037B92507